jgi:hypothetical protein
MQHESLVQYIQDYKYSNYDHYVMTTSLKKQNLSDRTVMIKFIIRT